MVGVVLLVGMITAHTNASHVCLCVCFFVFFCLDQGFGFVVHVDIVDVDVSFCG